MHKHIAQLSETQEPFIQFCGLIENNCNLIASVSNHENFLSKPGMEF